MTVLVVFYNGPATATCLLLLLKERGYLLSNGVLVCGIIIVVTDILASHNSGEKKKSGYPCVVGQ